MFSIFDQHSMKGLTNFDASLVRSVEEIRKIFIQLKTYEEFKASMDIPNEYLSLDNLLSFLCDLLCCFILLVKFLLLMYVVEIQFIVL